MEQTSLGNSKAETVLEEQSDYKSQPVSTDSDLNPSEPLSYGNDIWDCIGVIADNTQYKTSFMKSLRVFIGSYKKTFDAFQGSLQKAIFQYEKEFVKGKHQNVVDTLSTAMVSFKATLDQFHQNVQSKAELIQKDLVEPLEMYTKHYNSTNLELIKQGSQFWNTLHQERTSMLFSKENYYNQMYQLQQIQKQYQEAAGVYGGQNNDNREALTDELAVTGIQDKKLQSQQTKTDIAKNEYKRCLDKLNLTIDLFDSSYRLILNKIQENDDSQINFAKYNLEKLSRYQEQLGKEMLTRCEEMNQTIDSVSSETDLRIFIESNRSLNQFLAKEEFQPYDTQRVNQTSKRTSSNNLEREKEVASQFNSPPKRSLQDSFTNIADQSPSSTASPVINENYISSSRLVIDEEGDEYEILNKESVQSDRAIVHEQMRKLLRAELITIDEKGYILQLMHNKYLRSSISDILTEITSPKEIRNHECLKIIADIIKFLLTLFVHEKSNDYKLLHTILETSQNIYYTHKNRKQFLAGLLLDHGIWQDANNWKECIDFTISVKIEEAQRRKSKRAKSTLALHQNKQDKNFLRKGFGKLKGMLLTKEQKQLIQMKENQNLIFNELSRFVQHFVNFSLPYEQANELLIFFCEDYQVEQSRMHLLLTELQSNIRNTSTMFTEKEQLIWSLQRRSNRLKAFGFSDTMQIAGMTIQYIDNDSTLRNLLLVCRDFNELLKDEVLKQALLRSSQHRLQEKRASLWLKILKIDPKYTRGEFEAFYQQSLLELPKHVEDMIEVDVNRSFNNVKTIEPKHLNKILKSYAVVNPNLDYCQGMNFIAGFLYLIFEEEALAFAVMREVISKFKMSQLLNTELPMLKLNFYQLDRLIAILLPDLHCHFRDETINSSYYSSPYFITLFTSVLQMQTTGDHSEKLKRFWDYFIIKGWKAVFKTAIIILREYEENLLSMPFEVMLTQIVFMPFKFLVANYEDKEQENQAIKQYDKQMNSIKLPEMLLERLKTEFDQNYKISVRSAITSDRSQSSSSHSSLF